MTETKELIWYDSTKCSPPKKDWYLCKIYDLLNCDEPYEWSEPYYNVVWFDVYWDCDGVVAAWAEIPESKFEVK